MKKTLLLVFSLLLCETVFAQWTKVSSLKFTGPSGKDSASLCFSIQAKGNLLFAATNKGVFKSDDNGDTWANLTQNYTATQGNDNAKCIAFVNNGVNDLVLAGTTTKVYASSDNGANWADKTSGIASASQVNAIVQVGKVLLAAVQTSKGGGVYASQDYGDTWAVSNIGLPDSAMGCFWVDNGTVFLGGGGQGVYASTDNGATWAKKGTGLRNVMIRKIVRNGNILYAGDSYGSGMYVSSNNGTSWTKANSGLPTSFCQIFDMLVNNGNVVAAVDGNPNPKPVYVSTNNGASWNDFSSGLPAGFFAPAVGQNSTGTNLFTVKGFSGDVYRTGNVVTALFATQDTDSPFSVYPNPAKSSIFITPNAEMAGATLSIYNASGEELLKSTQWNHVDVSSLSPGLYCVVLSNGNTTWKKRIVKQ